MATARRTKTAAKPAVTSKPTDVISLEQALQEEGEGRTPATVGQEAKKSSEPSKADAARKIMEEMWDDLQAGKVKRKDIIQRFVSEAGLTKAGASTYYGNIKKKMSKAA